MSRLTELAEAFWNWTGNPQYWRDKDILTMPIESLYFPRLDDMRNECIKLINSDLSSAEIDAFLLCMAIDAEEENILEVCMRCASNDFLVALVKKGIEHPQSEARWQVAELLRNEIPDKESYIKKLLCDSSSYVRKRARNILE